MPENFARMNIGEMHFNHRQLEPSSASRIAIDVVV